MTQTSENSAVGTLTSGYPGASLATHIRLAGVGSGLDSGLGGIGQSVSPDGTVVTTVGPPGITNAYGEVWTITATAKIAVNGVIDSVTANVIELAYVSGLLWQLNTAGYWYSKPRASAPWSAGTLVSPLSSHPFSQDYSAEYDRV